MRRIRIGPTLSPSAWRSPSRITKRFAGSGSHMCMLSCSGGSALRRSAGRALTAVSVSVEGAGGGGIAAAGAGSGASSGVGSGVAACGAGAGFGGSRSTMRGVGGVCATATRGCRRTPSAGVVAVATSGGTGVVASRDHGCSASAIATQAASAATIHGSARRSGRCDPAAGGGSSARRSGISPRRRSASDLRSASRINDMRSLQHAQQVRAGRITGQRHQGFGAGDAVGVQAARALERGDVRG